ncbi:hypothetical protein K439DRAFT_1657172 [Ramaria rubella]|nr:hypothetical protein K439DRAFT_1657172 [Ramaria rubella]
MPILPTDRVDKHAEFFFPDGNLVLIVGKEAKLAFRLHRGIVNRWSPVFRNMIDALDADIDPWKFLDCDVLVFDDDPVDFERLIRVLHDGTSSLDCSSANFPLLTSLLMLSHKYNMPQLQTHTLNHLFAAYPLSLPAWDVREAYSFSPGARQDRLRELRALRPHPLAVVSLSLQLGLPHLLIPAYLDLARFPVSDIICGYTVAPSPLILTSPKPADYTIPSESPLIPSTLHLPTLQTTAVLRGKETLQRFIADFIKSSVEKRAQSPLCRYIHLLGDPLATPPYPCAAAFARVSHEMLIMTAGVEGGVDSDPLFVLKCAVELLKELSHHARGVDENDADETTTFPINALSRNADIRKNGACAGCMDSFEHTVDVARRHIWNCLPKWFDLRKFLENGFDTEWDSPTPTA